MQFEAKRLKVKHVQLQSPFFSEGNIYVIAAEFSHDDLSSQKAFTYKNLYIHVFFSFRKGSFGRMILTSAEKVLSTAISHHSQIIKVGIIKVIHTSILALNDEKCDLAGDPLTKLLCRNGTLIQTVANQPCGQLFQAFFFHSFQCFSKGRFFLFGYAFALNDLGIDKVADRVSVELYGYGIQYGRESAIVLNKINTFCCDYDAINKPKTTAFNMYGMHAYQFVLMKVIQVVKNLFLICIKLVQEVVTRYRRIFIRQLYKQLFLKFSIKHDFALGVIYE